MIKILFKKSLVIVLSFLILITAFVTDFSGLKVFAATEGNFTYTLSNGKATITLCKSTAAGDIEIPTALGGCPVTEIGSMAFWGCTGITSVSIPKSVTTVKSNAFKNCSSLKTVYITDLAAWCNIDFADYYSNPLFYAKNLYLNNKLVSDLVIPESVTNIKDFAFYNCNSITSVTFPKGLNSVGKDAFYKCNSLNKVNISDLTAWCGIRFNNYKSQPLYYAENLYLDDVLITDLLLPDGLSYISDYAFYNCKSIKSILIPTSVTNIGNYAFASCLNISYVTIPHSVTDIGNYAFYLCQNLISVTLGNTVKSIGNYAFYNCANLSSINIPNSVTDIGNYAFSGCDALSNIIIPDSVTAIWEGTFYNCKALKSIVIPLNVTFLGEYAFSKCSELKEVIIKGNVTDISSYAFAYCDNLKKIYLPKELTNVQDAAFYNTEAITDIYYGGSADDWKNVTVGIDNGSFSNAMLHYNSLAQEHNFSDKWTVDLLPTYSANGIKSHHCLEIGCNEKSDVTVINLFAIPDIDNNGSLSADDLVLLKKVILGISKVETNAEINVYSSITDLNDDGKNNVMDLIRLKKIMLK